MIGVNVNGYDSKKLKAVMAKEKLTWRSFADDGSIIGTWNLPGTPTFPGEEAIDSALEELIRVAEADQKKAPR